MTKAYMVREQDIDLDYCSIEWHKWEQFFDNDSDRDISALIGILKNQGLDIDEIQTCVKQELAKDISLSEWEVVKNLLTKYQVGVK